MHILKLEVLFVHVCKPYDQVSGKLLLRYLYFSGMGKVARSSN